MLGTLQRARHRLEPRQTTWLVVAAAGLGFWLGLELRSGPAAAAVAPLYFLTLAFVAPLPMAAVAALYHDPLHATLLPWPVTALQHLRLGLRQLLAGQLAAAMAVLGLGIGAGWGRPIAASALLPLFCVVIYLGGLAASAGCAGLCAAASAARAPWLVRLRSRASGPFASERHAPFFYLPAGAFFAAAAAAMIAEVGLLRSLALLATPGASQLTPGPLAVAARAGEGAAICSVSPAAVALSLTLLVGPPLLVGLLLLLGGVLSYRRCALAVIPRVIEEARTVYGGRPAPADPPYGLFVSRLLPRSAAPHFCRELREQARAHRGLWATLVLATLLTLGYAANVGEPTAAAPLAAVVLAVWAASLPTRRTPRASGAAMALTLPRPAAAAWLGRLIALLFAAGHLGVALALTLAHRHGSRAALAVVAVLLGTAALSIGATTPRPARADQLGPSNRRWGRLAALTPPLALSIGLISTALSLSAGLVLLGALAAAGVIRGVMLATMRERSR